MVGFTIAMFRRAWTLPASTRPAPSEPSLALWRSNVGYRFRIVKGPLALSCPFFKVTSYSLKKSYGSRGDEG